jgi:2-polyprenyl-6-methoxyphenol hydroxylase-like FAD-dependent oxidoreductase
MKSHAAKRWQRAIAIGGSFSGLVTARILSDHFEQVTLIEQDKLNDWPEARKGQPQVRHVHGLLANGLLVLRRYFPDLLEALREGGAIVADVGKAIRGYSAGGYRRQFESGVTITFQSRPFLEWQIRRRVSSLPNVTVVDQCTVPALLTNEDGRVVTGVRTVFSAENHREASMKADLVVDTAGRGSASIKWLEALGYAGPEENAIRIGVGYTTRIYRRRPDDLIGAHLVIIGPDPPHLRRMGMFIPMEDDRWNISLAGWAGDHAPSDEAGFLEYARSLAAPDIYNVLPRLEPLTDFVTHKFPSNLRRHYEKLTRFPEGYLVLGDAVCSFNPVYAQGMVSAAMQAEALDKSLTGRGSLDGLWKAYFQRASKAVDIPWQSALGNDFLFPETQGRKPARTDLINAYLGRVVRATHHDTVVHGAFLRVYMLMAPRKSLFRLPILWRVLFKGIGARVST